ncbi:unnamed protein product [Miscanthus lutarioriparius]|uniref:Uncharacterized protein n=1 Tax=Miscanthus lutarioriparius TaxID=422564 RepID=A0A811QFI2_9POAL|nr:unnamed protein product [Miscanthus lutarioriparius]
MACQGCAGGCHEGGVPASRSGGLRLAITLTSTNHPSSSTTSPVPPQARGAKQWQLRYEEEQDDGVEFNCACVHGLAAILYNASHEKGCDAFAVAGVVSQKIGLPFSQHTLRFDELRKSLAHLLSEQHHCKELSQQSANTMSDFQEIEQYGTNKDDQHPILSEIFDSQFVHFFSKLEDDIRENIMDIISQIKTATAVLPTESEQKNGEVDGEYLK